jgi:hypothetical protein
MARLTVERVMPMTTSDLYRLAADLAAEHGDLAIDYARRAVVCFETAGAEERARFWFMLSVFLDDIMLQRLDPELPITVH